MAIIRNLEELASLMGQKSPEIRRPESSEFWESKENSFLLKTMATLQDLREGVVKIKPKSELVTRLMLAHAPASEMRRKEIL